MDVALERKEDTPPTGAEVLVGEVGAETLEEDVVDVLASLPESSVEGGTADPGLPRVLSYPDPDGGCPPGVTSSSFSPERSPWENLLLR